jgi:peptidylprolyl isomerase
MRARTTAAALLATAALGVAACGDDDESASTATQPAAPPTKPGETQTSTATTAAGPLDAASISKDLDTKPQIPKPTGAPPSRLVVRDIVKGDGRTVRLNDTVTVQYVGVSYSTGEQFDASWDRGSPAQFQLSEGQLIQGWIEGIPGMKVGGRRLLVIPPTLGYGTQGQPPDIGPNETLVFVIDMIDAS